MILRRVVEHLRHQRWAAIGTELVIVVLGVFVGIQASNWNAEAIERREVRDAMQRLAEDMRQSISMTQASIDFMERNAKSADFVLQRLRACQVPDADRDEFATGLYRLGKTTVASFVRTTFDELKDSGRFRLIRSAALRSELNELARVYSTHEVVFRLIATRMEPHIAYIDSQVIYEIERSIGGGARIGWTQIDLDFAAACKDRRFQAAVGSIRNYTFDSVSSAKGFHKRFVALLDMIEKEAAP